MCPWAGTHVASFKRQLLGAAHPFGVSPTTRGMAPASLLYDRLTPVAWVAEFRCLAGDPLLHCVPARLSAVAFMAPGDACHGPQCSLAMLESVAFGYHPCCWPAWSAGSPQCAPPGGVWFVATCPLAALGAHVCAVPTPPWLLFTAVRAQHVLVCGVRGHLALVHRCTRWCVVCAVYMATWRFLTGARAWRIICAVFVSTSQLFTGVRAWYCMWAVSLATGCLFTGVRARRVYYAVFPAS